MDFLKSGGQKKNSVVSKAGKEETYFPNFG